MNKHKNESEKFTREDVRYEKTGVEVYFMYLVTWKGEC